MEKYKQKNVVKLDLKDRKILEQLNENSRMSLTDISRKTGIPIDTIKYRIERMEKEHIFKYAVILDFARIGYPIFNEVHIQFVNFTTQEEARVKRYVKSDPNIIYSAKIAGKYDYIIAVLAKDMANFDDVLNRFKTAFQNIIKDYDIALVIEEYKLDYVLDLINNQ